MMRKLHKLPLIVLSLSFALLSTAHGSTVPVIKATPVERGAVKVDGLLEEAVWQSAPRHSGFTVLRHSDRAAAEETVFQVAVSPDGIYWAFRAQDRSIKSTEKLRDGAVWHDDCLEIFITPDDPVPDDPNVRRCRQFLFNPRGTRYDASYLAGIGDGLWNTDWQAAVRRTGNGFTAEVFLPFYAFDCRNAGTRWRFNIGRENYTGSGLEISVWSPANTFMQMDRYAVLELPERSYRRYDCPVDGLTLKTVPADGGTVQQLGGRVTGRDAALLTLQAIVRKDGKLKGFNRVKLKLAPGGATDFAIPLALSEAGRCQVTLTGRDKEGKVFHIEKNLDLQTVPFSLNLRNPVYRNTVFADQPDKTVRLEVTWNAAPELLKKVKTVLTVADGAGQVAAQEEKNASARTVFSLDSSSWAPGDYLLTVRTSGDPALAGELRETIHIEAAPARGNTVRLGENREIILNGERFFPRGFMGGSYEEELFRTLSESGFNTFHFYMLNRLPLEEILRILDQAQKYRLKVIMYPYYRTGIGFFGFTEPGGKQEFRLSPAARARMAEMVRQVKDHPAFLGWYLYDEPRGAEFCAELSSVYRELRRTDPHHPVIGLDCSADGCINKKEGFCDLHILDLYPHPQYDGSFMRSIATVLGSMKQVDSAAAPAGAWFCPEAFTPLDGKSRPIKFREIRGLIFGAVIQGATGILPYKIGDPRVQYYEPDRNSGIFYAPDTHLGYLKGIGPELRSLEKVLLEPERLKIRADRPELLVMRKKHNGREFLFAVNSGDKPVQGRITAPGSQAQELRVSGEKRSVAVRNGRFTDQFAPHEAHIYTDDGDFQDAVDIAALEIEIAELDAAARQKTGK